MINKLDFEMAEFDMSLVPNIIGEFETKDRILQNLKINPITFEDTFALDKK